MDQGSRLLRIGIFYDGNYFYHVSNYYCYAHARRSRLSIPGLHEFIKHMVSTREGIDSKLCQIVDCHYFRGRLPAMEANARQILLNERVFDDILMREGVVTHYLPMQRGGEKGVDVSLALETLELTLFKKFNVVVLIASDGDYVPLVRKLNSLGTRVMVLGWDFEYMDDNGNLRYTTTSAKLMSEVSYPIRMHDVINGLDRTCSPVNVDALFVLNNSIPSSSSATSASVSSREAESSENSLLEANGESSGDYDDLAKLDDPPSGVDDESSSSSGSVSESASAEQGADDVSPASVSSSPSAASSDESSSPESGRKRGKVIQLKNGYGFLTTENAQKNLFFFWEDVENSDFNQLHIGDVVEYEVGQNDRGECARKLNLITNP